MHVKNDFHVREVGVTQIVIVKDATNDLSPVKLWY